MKFYIITTSSCCYPSCQNQKTHAVGLEHQCYRLILTWRPLSCHNVDEREALTLGGQHKYLPVERLG